VPPVPFLPFLAGPMRAGGNLARASKMSVLKRQRERQKAEKAARKREERTRETPEPERDSEADPTRDELEGYGIVFDRSSEDER